MRIRRGALVVLVSVVASLADAALYAATDGGLAVSALRVSAALTHDVVEPGTGSALEVMVTNDGPDEATQVALTVEATPTIAIQAPPLIAGGTCTTTPIARCEIPHLDPGQTQTFSFDLLMSVAGQTTIAVTATAAQDVGDDASASIELRAVDGPYVSADVVRVVKRKALLPIACHAVERKNCKGTVRLVSTSSAALGKGRFSIHRGRFKVLEVRLKGVTLDPGASLDADVILRSTGGVATERVVLRRE